MPSNHTVCISCYLQFSGGLPNFAISCPQSSQISKLFQTLDFFNILHADSCSRVASPNTVDGSVLVLVTLDCSSGQVPGWREAGCDLFFRLSVYWFQYLGQRRIYGLFIVITNYNCFKAIFLIVSVVTKVNGILNEIFLLLEQNLEVTLSTRLSVTLFKCQISATKLERLTRELDLKKEKYFQHIF